MDIKRLTYKVLIYLWAFFLAGAGVVLMIYSGLGAGPWDIFHIGLSNHTPFTMGRAGQLVGLILIVVGWFLGEKPGLGTFMNMYFIGFFIDLILKLNLIGQPQFFLLRFAFMLFGIWLFGWATYLYIKQGMCSGPRDALMVGLIKKTGWPLWIIRTLIEGSALVLGFIMGGPVGLGTVLFMLLIGPIVQFSFKMGKIDAAEIEHEDIIETFRPLFDRKK